jgi:nucleolar complex protein 3
MGKIRAEKKLGKKGAAGAKRKAGRASNTPAKGAASSGDGGSTGGGGGGGSTPAKKKKPVAKKPRRRPAANNDDDASSSVEPEDADRRYFAGLRPGAAAFLQELRPDILSKPVEQIVRVEDLARVRRAARGGEYSDDEDQTKAANNARINAQIGKRGAKSRAGAGGGGGGGGGDSDATDGDDDGTDDDDGDDGDDGSEDSGSAAPLMDRVRVAPDDRAARAAGKARAVPRLPVVTREGDVVPLAGSVGGVGIDSAARLAARKAELSGRGKRARRDREDDNLVNSDPEDDDEGDEGDDDGEDGEDGQDVDGDDDDEDTDDNDASGVGADDYDSGDEDAARGGSQQRPAIAALADRDAKRRAREALAEVEAAGSKRELIATICSEVTEDPESALSRIAEVEVLIRDPSRTVARLAILSLCAVYQDIVPDYRIRQRTAAELGPGKQLSREVQQQQDYESLLLRSYSRYIATLTRLLLTLPHGKAMPAAHRVARLPAATALTALATLLPAHPNFNLTHDILAAVAPYAHSPAAVLRHTACHALAGLYRNDKDGSLSLAAVKITGDIIKRRGARRAKRGGGGGGGGGKGDLDDLGALAHSSDTTIGFAEGTAGGGGVDALDTWLALSTDLLGGASTAYNMTKQERKVQNRKRRRLEAGIAEVEERAEAKKRERRAATILETIFVTYFRIVKDGGDSVLLPGVLRGMSRFAHLISVEFMGDMVTALRSVATRAGGSMAVDNVLHCACAAFQTMTGVGAALQLDLGDFHVLVYRTMNRPDATKALVAHFGPLSRCLRLMFIEQRQLSIERVAAFCKRLATLAIAFPPHAAIASMQIIRNLLSRYPRLSRVLDGDEGVCIGVGGAFKFSALFFFFFFFFFFFAIASHPTPL